jgi:hypothetical protein
MPSENGMIRKGFEGFLKGEGEVLAQKGRIFGVILDKERCPVYIPCTIKDLPELSRHLQTSESLTVLPLRR